MTPESSADPWTRSHFAEFAARRREFSLQRQTAPPQTYNSRNLRPSSHCPDDHAHSQSTHETSPSQIVGQTENATVLLLFDSFSKEKYMNSLLEKFQHVERKVEDLSREALSLRAEEDDDEIPGEGHETPPRSSNAFLESISQHHSKGEVVSKEALKLVRQMHKKFHTTIPFSPSTRQIHRAIHQRWAAYNSKFQETESRFKSAVAHMITEDEGLRERLVPDETHDTAQLHVLESYASSQSQWEHLYAIEHEKGREIEALHRDLNELNVSYQELNSQVLHQGGILDDIRHNIALGSQSMDQGIQSVSYSTKNVSLCPIM